MVEDVAREAGPAGMAAAAAAGGGGDSDTTASLRGDGGARASGAMVPVSWLAGGGLVVALLLFGLQQSLRLPSGFGIEDVLGWTRAASVHAAVRHWCEVLPLRWHAAATYVLADTALFMPLYGALLLAGTKGLRHALQTGPARAGALPCSDPVACRGARRRGALACRCRRELRRRAAHRRPAAAWGLGLLLGAGLFAVLWRTVAAAPEERARSFCRNLAAIVAVLATLALLVGSQAAASACRGAQAGAGCRLRPGLGPPGEAGRDPAGARTRRLRGPRLVVRPRPPTGATPGQARALRLRAAWRAGVLGVVGRTRYVIVVLVLFAVFTLVLDQCRDVLLALARPASDTGATRGVALAWRSRGAAARRARRRRALAHSCWLWTRLAGDGAASGFTLPGDEAAACSGPSAPSPAAGRGHG